MVKTPINMSDVFNRKVCMSDTRPSNDRPTMPYHHAMAGIKAHQNTRTVQQDVSSFLKECATKANAEKYVSRAFKLLDALGEHAEYDTVCNEAFSFFTNNVLPYMEHPNRALQSSMVSTNLWDKHYAEQLKEACDRCHICDRVLDNHAKLSKRFKINEFNKYTTQRDIVSAVCEMVDTYNIKPHIKMELVFEESVYLMDKYGIKLSQPKLVEETVDYFLSTCTSSDDIHTNFPKAITESKILGFGADKNVKYLMGTKPAIYTEADIIRSFVESERNSVKELINDYKTETNKSDSVFKRCLNKIFTQSPQAVIDETPDILKWVRNFGVFGVLTKNAYAAAVALVVNGYMHFDLRQKEWERVIKYFEKEKENVDDKLFSTMDDEKKEKLETYAKELDSAIEKLKKYNDSLYTTNELMNKNDDDINFESATALTEKKTIVQMQSMIQDAVDADKFIDKLTAQALKKSDATKTSLKDFLSLESFERYIDSDGRVSMVLSSYDISRCADRTKLYETVDSIVGATNNFLKNRSSKVYYTMLEGTIEFELRSKFLIHTTMAEEAMYCENQFTDVEMIKIMQLSEAASTIDKLAALEPHTLTNKAMRKVGSLTHEQAIMFVEAWGYGSPISKESMSEFVDYYNKYQLESGEYLNAYEIKRLFENMQYNYSADFDTITESTQIMYDIVNEAVDLNSLKLALMGFKKKIKDLGAKEKEASRDIDMTFNHFIKGVKNFYGATSKREQIIKGQVAPSLSKVIKIGITLADVGVAANSIVVPAILLVGGLAMNAHTSNKEKKMLLDEIDIELKVVEREIQRVENDGKSSRKYRTLLTYQKNLQREKQRIVYGLSRKGIHIPSSSAGVNARGGVD